MTLIFSNENRIRFDIKTTDQSLRLYCGKLFTDLFYSKDIFEEQTFCRAKPLVSPYSGTFLMTRNRFVSSRCPYLALPVPYSSSCSFTLLGARRAVRQSFGWPVFFTLHCPLFRQCKVKKTGTRGFYLQDRRFRNNINRIAANKLSKRLTLPAFGFLERKRTKQIYFQDKVLAFYFLMGLTNKKFVQQPSKTVYRFSLPCALPFTTIGCPCRTLTAKQGVAVGLFGQKRTLAHQTKKDESGRVATGHKKKMVRVFITDPICSLKNTVVFALQKGKAVANVALACKIEFSHTIKIKIWSLAFGSSFLIVSITSILQKQEQDRWFFPFFRRQMPGLYQISQDGSLESFENIASKYINRQNLAYRSSHKGANLLQISPAPIPIKNLALHTRTLPCPVGASRGRHTYVCGQSTANEKTEEKPHIAATDSFVFQRNRPSVVHGVEDDGRLSLPESELERERLALRTDTFCKGYSSTTPWPFLTSSTRKCQQTPAFLSRYQVANGTLANKIEQKMTKAIREAPSLLKNIRFYKDQLDITFSESWNQQQIKDFTAVFPRYGSYVCSPVKGKSFSTASLSRTDLEFIKKGHPLFSGRHHLRSLEKQACNLQMAKLPERSKNKTRPTLLPSLCDILLPKTVYQSSIAIDTGKGGRARQNRLTRRERSSFESHKKKNVYKDVWIVQPWYQLHARTPPKEQNNLQVETLLFGSSRSRLEAEEGDSKRINLFKVNAYKERVCAENDSIPSKMSCSTAEEDSQAGKKYIHASSDTLKTFFYRYGTFSIQDRGLRAFPQDNEQLCNFSTRFRHLVPIDDELRIYRFASLQGLPPSCKKSKKVCRGTKIYSRVARLPIERISNCVLEKANTISNRLMSGYQIAELNDLDLKSKISGNALSIYRGFTYLPCPLHVLFPKGHARARRGVVPLLAPTCSYLPLFAPTGHGTARHGKHVHTRTLPRKGHDVTPPPCPSLPLLAPTGHGTARQSTCVQRLFYQSKNRKEIERDRGNKQANHHALFHEPYGICLPVLPCFSASHAAICKTTQSNNASGFSYLQSPMARSRSFQLRLAHMRDVSIKVPPALPFYRSKIDTFNRHRVAEQDRNEASILQTKVSIANPPVSLRKAGIDTLKEMPYKELSLNCFSEVQPLFEEVNQAMRISPYRFCFNTPLFSNYNDYLSWKKDTPAAISISPSLEEDLEIQNGSLYRQDVPVQTVQFPSRVNAPEVNCFPLTGKTNATAPEAAREARVLGVEDLALQNVDVPRTEPGVGSAYQSFSQQGLPSKGVGKSSPDSLLTGVAEQDLHDEKSVYATDTPNSFLKNTEGEVLQESQHGVGDEEKKREMTRFEWLLAVREAEQPIEKAKDFQKVAYPNKKALFTKRLPIEQAFLRGRASFSIDLQTGSPRRSHDAKPKKPGLFCGCPALPNKGKGVDTLPFDFGKNRYKQDRDKNQVLPCKRYKKGTYSLEMNDLPAIRKIQDSLVKDRKDSFFGIPNLFPKRLIAEDQKQINEQIVQESNDQRHAAFLSSPAALATYSVEKPSTPSPTEKCVRDPRNVRGVTSCPLLAPPCPSLPLLAPTGHGTARHGKVRVCTCVQNEDKRGIFVEQLLQSGALNRLRNSRFVKREGVGTKFEDWQNPGTPCFDYLYLDKNTFYRNKKFIAKQITPRSTEQNSASACPYTYNVGTHAQQSKAGLPVEQTESFFCFSSRQQPIYTPNRRLRLRLTESSLSSQNNTPQSRIDDLNVSQSHRWWQKRRIASSLLGAPSRRYLVMPEITAKDWRKIIEWQLKTYLLEEEKRLQPLVLEKIASRKADFSFAPQSEEISLPAMVARGNKVSKQNVDRTAFSHKQNLRGFDEAKLTPFGIRNELDTRLKESFKIKKIAVYLPWATLKKSLKKPFEWPLTLLSFRSNHRSNPIQLREWRALKSCRTKSFLQNRKSNLCFVSSISSQCNTSPLLLLQKYKTKPSLKRVPSTFSEQEKVRQGKDASSCFCKTSYSLDSRSTCIDLQRNVTKKQLQKSNLYKPFLFEKVAKHSHLVVHQLLLAIAIKHFFHSIYKVFGKVVLDRLKNSSLGIAFLPVFLNSYRRSNRVAIFCTLKERFKDLVASEDTVSSLSEIVWSLRNSCRGRMVPRGVVLVETTTSESTEYLKAIGGEAQVPVIVQSLRALTLTKDHPQRRLETILTFAQKKAPCILFLDDLDAIGKSRSLLFSERSDRALVRYCPAKFRFVSKARRFRCASKATSCHVSPRRSYKSYGARRSIHQSAHFPLLAKSLRNSGSYRFTSSQKNSIESLSIAKQKTFVGFTSLLQDRATTEKRIADTILPETEKIVEQRRVDLMLRLLTVMDGITHLNGVLIITTTQNPSLLDPALLRPGRFEKLIDVTLPDKKRRIRLLKTQTSKIGYTSSMPWEYFATRTHDMAGAEIASAINHSAFRAIVQSTVHTTKTLEHGINRVNRVC